MYIIFFAILLISTLFFLKLKYFKKIKQKNEDLANFIVTLIATFLGLFLALYFNRIEVERKEKVDVEKLVLVAIEDLEHVKRQAGVFYAGLVYESDTSFVYSEYTDRNPKLFPAAYTRILENDLVARHLSFETLNRLTTSSYNLTKMIDVINNQKVSNNIIKLNTDIYGRQLNYTIKVLYAELALLSGEINKSQLVQYHEKFGIELTNVDMQELDRVMNSSNSEVLDWGKIFKKE